MQSPLRFLAFATAVLLAASLADAQTRAPQERIQRGEYLAAIMDCGGCHTPGVFLGKPDMARKFAGSEVGFKIPGLGTFFPPNLTPDRETGLGAWSEQDIIKAVRNRRQAGRARAGPSHALQQLWQAERCRCARSGELLQEPATDQSRPACALGADRGAEGPLPHGRGALTERSGKPS